MKPLSTNQLVLKLCCVFPSDETTSKGEKICCIILSLFIFIVHTCATVAGMIFFIDYLTIDLGKSLNSLFNTFGDGSMAFWTLVTVLQRQKLAVVFVSLSNIYDTCNNQ